jgi:single-strand DNA-binding protein
MINKVILVGNVGADPEVRTLETGTKVARVRLATTERIFNRQTQETKEYTEWHTVVLWSGLADVADKYVRKGSQIYIEGSLRTNEWTDKENVKRYTVEVIAREMKLLGRRSDSPGGGSPQGYGQGAGNGGGAPAPFGAQDASGASSSAARPAPAPEPVPVDDPDDLPF